MNTQVVSVRVCKYKREGEENWQQGIHIVYSGYTLDDEENHVILDDTGNFLQDVNKITFEDSPEEGSFNAIFMKQEVL